MPSIVTAQRLARTRAAFPSGVASVHELVASGIPERTAYRRCLDGGPWQLILPGIVLLCSGVPTRDQSVRAALLLGGRDAVVTGLEACRRHGIRRGPARPEEGRDPLSEVHILVPIGRQVRSTGFVHVERTRRLPTPVSRQGLRLAPVPRACIDAARRIRQVGQIAELLSDPVQRGLCTVAALAHEVAGCSRRGTAMPRAVLADVAEGVRSAAEREARKLWARTGLPDPSWNARVHDENGMLLGVVDCWLDDVAMAWEIESTEWHISPHDHDRTVDRAARFVAAGVVYLASKPKKLHTDRATIIQLLRQTYEQAAGRRRPPVRVVRAPG